MSTSQNIKVNSKRSNSKRQQKKTMEVIEEKPIIEEIKEVKPKLINSQNRVVSEVIVDNGFTKSMKKDNQEVKQEIKENNQMVGNGEEKPKRKTPVIFVKRNELSLYIVKETDFKGFRAPINKLISWIIENVEDIKKIANKESNVDDKIKQLDEVKNYFDKNKEKCQKLIKDFTPEKKEKKTYEDGKYFIVYFKDDVYSFVCIKNTGITGNMSKHNKEGYKNVHIQKIDENYDLKAKKEEFKKCVEFTGRNSFKILETSTIEDFYKLI